MFGIESFNISFKYNVWYLMIFAVLAFITAYIYYWRTNPVLSLKLRTYLTINRFLMLFFLLLLLFDPNIVFTYLKTMKPINLIFVDESASMSFNDNFNRKKQVTDLLSKLDNEGLLKNSKIYRFSDKVDEADVQTIMSSKFSGAATNFEKIFSTKDENINPVLLTIISDGQMNSGESPFPAIDKKRIPILTYGVGNPKAYDIEINKILAQDVVFVDNQTRVSAVVKASCDNSNAFNVSLLDDGKLVSQKNVSFGKNESIKTVNFDYTPKSIGEKKLSIAINSNGDLSSENNHKEFYLKVLDDKQRIVILSGSPSADLSFIMNSFKNNPKNKVSTVTQIGENKFLEKGDVSKILDSSDVLVMVGFPNSQTSDVLLKKASELCSKKSTLFVLSANVDILKLKNLQKNLSFSIDNISSNYLEVQPSVVSEQSSNALLANNSQAPLEAWNNLPPVYYNTSEFKAKPESEVLAKVRVKTTKLNYPLIISRKIGQKRDIAILAKDIWKWKLQTAKKNIDIFDRFLNNTAKWLFITDDNAKFTVKTDKKLYYSGEQVNFSASFYDDALNPIENAEIYVNIKSTNNNQKVFLNSVGMGVYEVTVKNLKPGEFSFEGIAKTENKTTKSLGNFAINKVNIEYVNPALNSDFLRSLSAASGGKYFQYGKESDLINEITKRLKNSSYDKEIRVNYNLIDSIWIVILFSIMAGIEWFIRKRNGML